MKTLKADLGYDLFIFKPQTACIVRVRQTRYRIDPDTFYEDLIPDDLRIVRGLPFPHGFPREIWLRTRHERNWRRLRVYKGSVGEIDWWGRTIIPTPIAGRQPFPPGISLYKGGHGRTVPFPGSFLRRRAFGPDPDTGSSSGSGATPLQDY